MPRLTSALLRPIAVLILIGGSLMALWLAGVFDKGAAGTPDQPAPALQNASTSLDTPGSSDRAAGLKEGQLAPDFAFSAFDGSRQRLSDYRGKAVLLNFWASWCIPCRLEMPDIQA